MGAIFAAKGSKIQIKPPISSSEKRGQYEEDRQRKAVPLCGSIPMIANN
jgi:hypothetical protein